MALGYFFLSVFCILTGSFVIEDLRLLLLVASLAALLMGFGFLCSAFAVQIRACRNWLIKAVCLAQQPPVHGPVTNDKHLLY